MSTLPAVLVCVGVALIFIAAGLTGWALSELEQARDERVGFKKTKLYLSLLFFAVGIGCSAAAIFV